MRKVFCILMTLQFRSAIWFPAATAAAATMLRKSIGMTSPLRKDICALVDTAVVIIVRSYVGMIMLPRNVISRDAAATNYSNLGICEGLEGRREAALLD